MTPQEFIKYREDKLAKIHDLHEEINEAEREAKKTQFPKKVRPATEHDITYEAVIWYTGETMDDDEPCFMIVEEVHHPSDPWKAYTAEDGCRYGLDDAWVEVSDGI